MPVVSTLPPQKATPTIRADARHGRINDKPMLKRLLHLKDGHVLDPLHDALGTALQQLPRHPSWRAPRTHQRSAPGFAAPEETPSILPRGTKPGAGGCQASSPPRPPKKKHTHRPLDPQFSVPCPVLKKRPGPPAQKTILASSAISFITVRKVTFTLLIVFRPQKCMCNSN